MSNGMSGLYVGTSGLSAAQAALNTTANNLANINTVGYTRQQITYITSNYYNVGNNATGKLVCGTGVDVSEIRRVRDELIDKAYRQEKGRLGYYDSQYDAVTEVESLFGELDDNSFQNTMTDLYNSIKEISKNPASTIDRSSLLQSASAFVDKASSVYSSLKNYQTTLNTKITNMVNKINSLGQTICDLNKKILDVECVGQKANDLRDKRDNALDELSGYIKIQYQEDKNGSITVTAEGATFVSKDSICAMGTEEIAGTDLLKPVWPLIDNRDVFLDAEKITVIDNNDVGELKGLLISRGYKAVNYSDVPVEPTIPDASSYNMTDATQLAAYQAAKDKYDVDNKQYESDCDYYNKYIDPSVILSTMASLDKLTNGIVTAINDILCPEKTASFTAADGTVYTDATILDMEKTSYGDDADKSVGVELFSRKNTDRYIKVTGNDGSTYYVRNNKNDLGLNSEYTLGNIQMNETATQNKATIPLTTARGEEDFDKGKALVDAWNVKFASLNPSTYAKENFDTFYNSLVTEFADTGSVLKNMVTNQTTMADGYNGQRLQTEGVSSDEELQNMIKFQQAYNAASRYVSIVSDMLEQIVTRLGN